MDLDNDTMSEFAETSTPASRKVDALHAAHYYGDYVRNFLFIGGILLLVTFPLFKEVLTANFILIFLGVGVIILAGITTRRFKLIFFVDAIGALVSIMLLELVANTLTFDEHPALIILTQLIAIPFVVGLYYCLRTVRGFFFK